VRQRLAAILAADAAGYSRLMSLDERSTMAALDAARAVFRAQVVSHQGRIIDTAGDSVLALFETATGAVSAALGVQKELDASVLAVPEERRMRFRIGVHLGDVIEKPDGSVYGDGVNIAARLQTLAEPGAVAVSESIRAAVKGKVAARIDDMGEKRVKNIADPLRVYRVRASDGGAADDRPTRVRSRLAVTIACAMLAAAAAGTWLGLTDSGRGARSWLAATLGGKPLRAAVDRPLIAVLPFANQSGDVKRDYFCDGVTEDIIGALGRFSGLMVVSQNAVLAYKGKAMTPQELRAQLGARYVVQGSVRESGSRLRATVELSDAEKGVLLWSERYDGEGAELFEIQDRIVRRIVTSLELRLTSFEQQRVFTRPTESLEAYDLVLRARSLLARQDRRSNREARALLARAGELSPDYVEVLTALGEAEVQRALYGWVEVREEAMKRADELARRVLASADTRAHARAHVLLGRIHSNLGQYKEALGHSESAIALNPSDATAIQMRGAALLYSGRVADGIEALESVRRIDPDPSPGYSLNLATAYYIAGKYPEALALVDMLVARFPRDSAPQAIRAATLAQLDRLEEARKASEQVLRLSPGFQAEHTGTRFANPEHTAKIREGYRKAGL
jgi:TolB-like protein/class 3 adenylate cyclase/Flp pilus assembly protein TadD